MRFINGLVRFLLGAFGLLLTLQGIAGAFYAGSDGAWGPATSAAIIALLGAALVGNTWGHTPWERARLESDARACEVPVPDPHQSLTGSPARDSGSTPDLTPHR